MEDRTQAMIDEIAKNAVGEKSIVEIMIEGIDLVVEANDKLIQVRKDNLSANIKLARVVHEFVHDDRILMGQRQEVGEYFIEKLGAPYDASN